MIPPAIPPAHCYLRHVHFHYRCCSRLTSTALDEAHITEIFPCMSKQTRRLPVLAIGRTPPSPPTASAHHLLLIYDLQSHVPFGAVGYQCAYFIGARLLRLARHGAPLSHFDCFSDPAVYTDETRYRHRRPVCLFIPLFVFDSVIFLCAAWEGSIWHINGFVPAHVSCFSRMDLHCFPYTEGTGWTLDALHRGGCSARLWSTVSSLLALFALHAADGLFIRMVCCSPILIHLCYLSLNVCACEVSVLEVM
jgi:hypothetical protein